MPLDGTLSLPSVADFADRIDLLAAEAFEAGLDQAAVVMTQLGHLLRAFAPEAPVVTSATVALAASLKGSEIEVIN